MLVSTGTCMMAHWCQSSKKKKKNEERKKNIFKKYLKNKQNAVKKQEN